MDTKVEHTDTLQPLREQHQDSFFGKARVKVTPEKITLISYNTAIAWIDRKNLCMTTLMPEMGFSSTSKKHLLAFKAKYFYKNIKTFNI